jgi:hypothetical protein
MQGLSTSAPRLNEQCYEGNVEGTAILSMPVAGMRLLLCEV